MTLAWYAVSRHDEMAEREMTLRASASIAMMAALLALSMPGGAWAEQLSTEVVEAAEEGRRLFDEGRYREAIDLLEEAYERFQEPIFFQYIGRCHQELEEYCEAAEYYRRFLEHGEPEPAIREELESRLSELDRQCEAASEPEPPPPGPPPEGPPRTFGGGTEEPPSSHRATDIAGYTLMGLAGATLIAGAALWGYAYGNLAIDIEGKRRCESDTSCIPVAVTGDVLAFGASALLLTAGVLVLVLGRRQARSQVSLMPGPGSVSFSVAWR